jgi:hypothetical protein
MYKSCSGVCLCIRGCGYVTRGDQKNLTLWFHISGPEWSLAVIVSCFEVYEHRSFVRYACCCVMTCFQFFDFPTGDSSWGWVVHAVGGTLLLQKGAVPRL